MLEWSSCDIAQCWWELHNLWYGGGIKEQLAIAVAANYKVVTEGGHQGRWRLGELASSRSYPWGSETPTTAIRVQQTIEPDCPQGGRID